MKAPRKIRVTICEYITRPSGRGTMPKPGTYRSVTVRQAPAATVFRAVTTALRAQGYSLSGDMPL